MQELSMLIKTLGMVSTNCYLIMNEEEILVSQVLSYNHSRYVSYIQDLPFVKNPEFEKILNARYCKVSRIKKRS